MQHKDPRKDQLTTLLILTFLFFTGFYAAKVTAGVDLVVPFYTKHIQYNQNEAYTEDFDNRALGLQYTTEHLAVGSTYVHQNSYSQKSLYSHVIGFHNFKNGIQLGGGAIVAVGGYEKRVIAMPVWAAQYKWLRLTTSYPGMRTITAFTDSQGADLLNVQLVIPLGD